MSSMLLRAALLLMMVCGSFQSVSVAAEVPAGKVPVGNVEGQPLAANVSRLMQAMEFLGHPFEKSVAQALTQAVKARDAATIQKLLDSHVLLVVSLNPEVRVKVARGPAPAKLQQGGFTPVLIKVLNNSTVTRQLNFNSPQSGPIYSGEALNSLTRQAQLELKSENSKDDLQGRFLQVEMFRSPPMTANLSGLEVEYQIGLIYTHEAGKREATLQFDVGDGTQDLGFRGEVPVLFQCAPAIPIELSLSDVDGKPTTARLIFKDHTGRIFPPQAKRLAPDFFFQPHIYRQDGEVVLLPPGKFTVDYSRGPEYRVLRRTFTVPEKGSAELALELDRWINPQAFGFYSGDHHIHGAGCAHYQNPTQGVTPADMFRQVKGEGLNVGCVLTWGPCFDFQRQYFSPQADEVSEPLCVLKYDLEISGFGSAALGHVCLLNLRNQTYPGSEGTATRGWPTWTVPVMSWAKLQGGVTGYPHSAMRINPAASAKRMLEEFDTNNDQQLSEAETATALLPEPFTVIDADKTTQLTLEELTASINRAADQLPNLAVPEMNGGGAMEICVSVAAGVCDFISAMDTERIQEWTTWYHLMNCGFPLKLSGETDFPCMSSRRVGQGRVYVQLGQQSQLDFGEWCRGIADGRSYVSDGFAHALDFRVNNLQPGPEPLQLSKSQTVTIQAKVSFAEELPEAVAYGTAKPPEGNRAVGDTRILHVPRSEKIVQGGERLVEIVKNGEVVARKAVPADGEIHDLKFEVNVTDSSWIALRQFPQLHTNPVTVLVNNRPIRASRDSARWCAETIRLLWKNRNRRISEKERGAAYNSYQAAIAEYEKRGEEAHARTQSNP